MEYEYKAGEVVYVSEAHEEDCYYLKSLYFNAHGAVIDAHNGDFIPYGMIRPLTDEEKGL
jgi:hypothetical protein